MENADDYDDDESNKCVKTKVGNFYVVGYFG